MINLKVAILADAANVREGLLSVLGGGISILRHPSYPVALNADVGLLFELTDPVEGQVFEIGVMAHRVNEGGRSEGDPIFGVEARLITGPLEANPAPYRNAPLALPLKVVGVPGPGKYRVTIAVDGAVVGGFSFAAELRDFLPGEREFFPFDEPREGPQPH